MKPSTPSLIAGGIAIALAGGMAQGTEIDPTMPSDQPRMEDKPPGTPGRGNQGNNDRRGPPDDHGQHGPGNFAPPNLPAPPGHDRPDNPVDDGMPGLGLGRDPGGVCEADDDDFNIPGPAGQAGASHTAHVNFVGVDEAGEILDSDEAPWGRMTYFWIAPTFDFVFNGHNLIVGDEGNIVYTLAAEIEDDEGEVSLLCLGSAEVNDGGNVHVLNSIELDSHLPPDLELDDEGDDEGGDDADDDAAPGVGLVLLPEDAVDCETGETFDDAEGDVLFSVEDVLYVDTDLAEEDGDDGDD